MHQIKQSEYRNLLSSVTRFITQNGGNRTDAEDFLNEVLMRFYAGELNYQQGNFGGYICQVVKNKWIDYMRKNKNARKVPLYASNLENQAGEEKDVVAQIDYDNFLRQADWENHQTAVVDALWGNNRLIHQYSVYRVWENTECKERLERVYAQGLSNQTIAHLEKISATTFNQRLKRCRDKFINLYKSIVRKK